MELGMNTKSLESFDISRIIEMAWEDRTPFEAIQEITVFLKMTSLN